MIFSSFYFLDVSGISQKWHKLRRRCSSFKAVSGPTSLDSDASYMLAEPATTYVAASRDRQQRAASMTPIIDQKQRQYSWRKSHSVEKYDYRDVNLNNSIADKTSKKQIQFPDEYWKVQEEDVKTWRIGSLAPNQSFPVRDVPRDSTEWEYSVQAYESMCDRQPSRIQYFTGSDGNGNRKNSLESDRKEMKFPGLKAFKSASMRLPGQKSSLQEVHQLLRNKFNRLNVGLRKKRTMSVQEVFQGSPSQQNASRPPTQFYVPSPVATNKIYEEEIDGPSSLPFYVNSSASSENGQSSKAKVVTAASKTSGKLGDNKRIVTRSQSQRVKAPSSKETRHEPKSETTNVAEAKKPQFVIGGRVSLREKSTAKQSTASKISNVVRDKIRMRPRSHSPVKYADGKGANTEPRKHKKNRESFGLFDRINRIMSINHLPPPHNNNNNNTNNMNPAKSSNPKEQIVSHDSADTKAATTASVAASSKKSPNSSATLPAINKSSSDSIEFKPQLPETIFVRDRKTTKQVLTLTFLSAFHLPCPSYERNI